MTPAFEYAKSTGIQKSSSYGYKNAVNAFAMSTLHNRTHLQQGSCAASGSGSAKVASFEEIELDGDEDELMKMVDEAPVATAMHISEDLQYYSSGVYSKDDCPTRCDSRRVRCLDVFRHCLSLSVLSQSFCAHCRLRQRFKWRLLDCEELVRCLFCYI